MALLINAGEISIKSKKALKLPAYMIIRIRKFQSDILYQKRWIRILKLKKKWLLYNNMKISTCLKKAKMKWMHINIQVMIRKATRRTMWYLICQSIFHNTHFSVIYSRRIISSKNEKELVVDIKSVSQGSNWKSRQIMKIHWDLTHNKVMVDNRELVNLILICNRNFSTPWMNPKMEM